jgi:NosR/NirI family transcriptional regulator, nitrous oxide reductase regulator
MALLAGTAPARATSNLEQFLPDIPLQQVFPGADHLGPVTGSPPVALAYQGERVLGRVFLNSDVVDATGYSGKPIHIAIGMDQTGKIVGAKLLKHHEPIVLTGIPPIKVEQLIASYVGKNPSEPGTGKGPDIISGATVTTLVIGDTITHAAILVARGPVQNAPVAARRQIAPDQPGPNLSGTETWEQLLADGSVGHLRLSVADINAAFAQRGAAGHPEDGPDDDTFLDVSAALVSVPVIGRSLLGERDYDALKSRLGPDRDAVLVMGSGRYSWRGSGYVRGGIFDRISVVQDLNTIRFHDRDYERLGEVAAEGAPPFTEIGLFVLPAQGEFDATKPWRLQVLVQRSIGALDKAFLTVDVPVQLPEKFLAPPPAPPPPVAAPEPLWVRIWQAKAVEVGILGAALVVLTLIFFFQDWLTRRPRLTQRIRLVFLAFTLLWIGWYADAQLSVVNILALSNTLVTGFSWNAFLMDPLLFVLWCAVAAALLFWGRGAFCGWLCPFGALQEFASLAARRLKIPQITVPWAIHERLWPIKYILFLGLFGLALYSLAHAEEMAEIEPFKTAIILKFLRHWPFVVYVGVLLGIGLFIERFFCRYLCPLGAALAIPARLRMFDWLKRHRECGTPCQRCANECPVQAIHPDGHINPNECIYCLHCQTLYWDQHRCPVMIQRRLKNERRATLSPPAPKEEPNNVG